MSDLSLKIDGMSCQHCVSAVKKALDELNGVTSSDVAVGSANIVYDDSLTDRATIAAAVTTAGYKVIG